MRIIFVSTLYSEWGGSEELWSKTAKLALQKGYKLLIVSYKQNTIPKHIQSLIQLGAKVYFLPNETLIKKSSFFKRIVFKIWSSIFYEINLRNNLNSFKPDVFIVNQGGNHNLFENKRLTNYFLKINIPFFLTVRLSKRFGRPEFVDRSAAIYVFRKALRIVFASENNKISTEKKLGINLNNCIILRSPLNLNSFNYLTWPSTSICISFACVSRLEIEFKGQDILIEALSSNKWKQRNWKLNFYGHGEDEEYLIQLVKFFGLSDKINFQGHVSNIQDIWTRNHIHILSSIEEGTPIALMESMICGRPAIVTDVGGNCEIVQELKTGFISKAPSVELLENTLELAWQNQEKWEKMGINAHEWCLKNLDLQSDQSFLNLIESV